MIQNETSGQLEISTDRWFAEFLILITLTGIASGLAYLYQNWYFGENQINNEFIVSNLVRALRMTIFYVLFPILFLRRHNRDWKELGILPRRNMLGENLVGGIFIYGVATYIFLENEIFFSGWQFLSNNEIIVKLILVAIMASITDLWTRGFILFEVANKYSDRTAIIVQNITWFTIHIYEIELLEPFIGYWNSILLTLFLGIGGDLVALRTRNIFGLMLGHTLLNVSIFLAANGYI